MRTSARVPASPAWVVLTLGVVLLGIASTELMSKPSVAGVTLFRYDHGEPLNNLRVTPGSVADVTASTVCTTGYAGRARDVGESEKLAVYAEYGIARHPTDLYEIDHLIPLELGGSNAIDNLWPEHNDHPEGYLNSKDLLENRLHRLVCSGSLDLHGAQRAIALNWVETYHRYLGVWPEGRRPSSTSTIPVPSAPIGPVPRGVTVVSLASPAVPGSYETLRARSSRPRDSCSLVVVLPSGAPSASKGLGRTSTNASGIAAWTWRIGTRTGRGVATALVTCTSGDAARTFVVS